MKSRLLSRIPFVARRVARRLAEHRRHMEFLVALRRAGREQAADPDTETTLRIYAVKCGRVRVSAPGGGRHRVA